MNTLDLEVDELQECCVPGCPNMGHNALCPEHREPLDNEPDYDPNGEEERHIQRGL